jgi:hypothetical protein
MRYKFAVSLVKGMGTRERVGVRTSLGIQTVLRGLTSRLRVSAKALFSRSDSLQRGVSGAHKYDVGLH